MLAWRIVKAKHAPTAFAGEGARRTGGRWNSRGTAVVYTSSSQSLAMLEILAHLEFAESLSAYVLISCEFDDSLIELLDISGLPLNWRASPAPSPLQALGDRWVRDRRSAVLRVPSTLVPIEDNFLLNPAHEDFVRIKVAAPEALTIDPRLLRHG